MTASILLDAMVNTGNKIDNLWSMYIVVHLGLFWFFFLVHRPLLLIERAVALFAYGVFAFINGNALLSSYKLLEALRRDLLGGFASEMTQTPATLETIAAAFFGSRDELIFITHLGAFTVVALFLIFRNVLIRRHARAFPAHAPGNG
ncbi:MAG: hypothetical protein ACFCUR_08865 [Rhodomicrobiaceae bacterium]